MNKNVVVYNPGRFSSEVWLPALWSQAKTYYEIHGIKKDQWAWPLPTCDIYADDLDAVKRRLHDLQPKVFAVSLYVWSFWIGHEVAAWVKQQWPDCLVITGGPHQYFKHDVDWFQKHPYIDASLPGECYGELCLQQVLDNVNDDGSIDFDQVTDLWYPQGKSRFPAVSKKTSSPKTKTQFDYDWPSFARQPQHINEFVLQAKAYRPDCKLLSILETTRGCPYGCTYCDWGGGINTAVIKKSFDAVEQDLGLLFKYDLKYLYIADANFGIFKERDVDIMQCVVKNKHSTGNDIKLGYGGFAKTENRLRYIKQILKLDFDNQLSNSSEIKISMQSLDPTVLDNIDRKNIDLGTQLAEFQDLTETNHVPVYVEMILGLPGMTLEKFYHELSKLAEHRLSVMWFEWLLLPEAPAYSKAYRQKFGIQTTTKSVGWFFQEIGANREIVIATSSLSTDDYLEILMAIGVYHACIHGGFYSHSIQHICSTVGLGRFIKQVMDDLKKTSNWSILQQRWDTILSTDTMCSFFIDDFEIRGDYYLIGCAFLDRDGFRDLFETALIKFGCNESKIRKDQRLVKNGNAESLRQAVADFMNFANKGKILARKSRFFDLW